MNEEKLGEAQKRANFYLKQIENDFLRVGSEAIFKVTVPRPRPEDHVARFVKVCKKMEKEPADFLNELRENPTAKSLFLAALNVSHEVIGAKKIDDEQRFDSSIVAIILLAKASMAPKEEWEFVDYATQIAETFMAHASGMDENVSEESKKAAQLILSENFSN